MKNIITILLLISITLEACAQQAQNTPEQHEVLIYKNQTRPDTLYLDDNTNASSSTWTKISGPSVGKIIRPNAAHALYVGHLAEGTYQFSNGQNTITLTVRDMQKKNLMPCRWDPQALAQGKKIVKGKSFTLKVQDYKEATATQLESGKYDYPYINRDNIFGEPVMGGDTIRVPGLDSCTKWAMGDFGGNYGCPVTVVPKGKALRMRKNSPVRMGLLDSNFIQHVVFDGTYLKDQGIPYGFMADNRAYPLNEIKTTAWASSLVSNMTVKGWAVLKGGITQTKIDSDPRLPWKQYDKFLNRSIVFTQCFFDSTAGEGIYLGNTDQDGSHNYNKAGPPPRFDSAEVSYCVFAHTKWDGIQMAGVRNRGLIKYNLVYDAGWENMGGQQAGAFLGGNTIGSIDSNIIIRTTGNGIQIFGYGINYVRGNIVDSTNGGKGTADAFYESQIQIAPEINDSLEVYNIGNLISRPERNYILVANNKPGTMKCCHSYENIFVGERSGNPDGKPFIDDKTRGVLKANRTFNSFSISLLDLDLSSEGPSFQLSVNGKTKRFTGYRKIRNAVEWIFSVAGSTNRTR